MVELWRGNANAWECDELGHMNVQFYLAKASEAVGNLAAMAGLGNVFRSDNYATLLARSLHIKFLAEAHPGAPLMIEGGITGHTDTLMHAELIMRHGGSGRVAATFQLVLEHVSPSEGRAFSWPDRFAAAADTLKIEKDPTAAPRGIEEYDSVGNASLARADQMGLEQIGMGRFTGQDIGPFGRIRADVFLGRVSNSVVNFIGAFPEEVAFHKGELDNRIGSALLETRILPRRWPREGDGYVIRSGLKSVSPKVRNLVHWVLDPATGKPWWTMEGVAAPMDLDARKLVEPNAHFRAMLEAAVVKGIRA
ncbi:thioesterase family protein [Maricaulis sp. MIT060901]|uniref:thioesterase family protein n=1 Tax=Maricaulis sp. MIT060901 TaxID=3096993 RepID=UPI00399BE9FF